jgi:hypothetical protein
VVEMVGVDQHAVRRVLAKPPTNGTRNVLRIVVTI